MSVLATRSVLVASLLARDLQRTVLPITREAAGPADAPVDASYAPLFVLSTEGAATDDHIVRQHWDLSRAAGVGTPVLWNHSPDVLLGQWRDHAIEGTPGTPGARLTARCGFDYGDELAVHRAGQVKRGMIRAVSVGWIPGALVRRGSLKEDDELFRPMEDDECGQPMEGFVMGTEAEPNILVEASLTPTPSDSGALAVERIARATRQANALARGDRVSGVDATGVIFALRDNPALRAYFMRQLGSPEAAPVLRAIVLEVLASPEGAAVLRSVLAGSPAPSLGVDRPFSDLLGG